MQELIALLITLTAIASYLNHRFIQLPSTIGVTVITLVISLLFISIDQLFTSFDDFIVPIIASIDFSQTFMGGMISYLLFAGALNVNTKELMKQAKTFTTLATAGVVISTLLIGYCLWGFASLLHLSLQLRDCLLFAALIAPTDPIAVLGCLKQANAPKQIEMKIAGESLFNDGSGIILFTLLVNTTLNQQTLTSSQIFLLFTQQLGGGLLLGYLLGHLVRFLLIKTHNLEVCILLTLSLVTAGFLLAEQLAVSGAITMVVAGLIIGSHLRSCGVTASHIKQLNAFWELLDELLNTVLFVLIGLVFLQVPLTINGGLIALIAIPVTLIGRYISIAIPIHCIYRNKQVSQALVPLLTWAGLRGGVSIALALSLKSTSANQEIILVTYIVVMFSILVQGLTMERVLKYYLKKS